MKLKAKVKQLDRFSILKLLTATSNHS